MNFHRITRGTAIGCAAGLVIAGVGCGGSGGLTRAQLATKVNGACAAYDSGLKRLGPQPSDFAQNPASAAAYLDKVKPLLDAAYNEIKDLKPADSVKADFDRFLSYVTRQRAFFESARTKSHASDPGALLDISSAGNLKKDVLTPLDQKLGFTRCVSG
jgi:hypothetical protein